MDKKVKELTIDCKPVAKERPRMTSGGVVYTPKNTREFEKMVSMFWKKKYGGDITFSEKIPLGLTIVFQYPKKNKDIWKTTKPDLSNLIKSVEDALNNCAYKDDNQISFINSSKIYGEKYSIKIIINEL